MLQFIAYPMPVIVVFAVLLIVTAKITFAKSEKRSHFTLLIKIVVTLFIFANIALLGMYFSSNSSDRVVALGMMVILDMWPVIFFSTGMVVKYSSRIVARYVGNDIIRPLQWIIFISCIIIITANVEKLLALILALIKYAEGL